LGTLNSALSTPGYLLALLRELSQCPRALTEIIMPKQVPKTNLNMFLVPSQKKGGKVGAGVWGEEGVGMEAGEVEGDGGKVKGGS